LASLAKQANNNLKQKANLIKDPIEVVNKSDKSQIQIIIAVKAIPIGA
jgi:hypothetical protein